MDRLVALRWSTWKTRNDRVFRYEISNSVHTLIRAKKANAEWRIRHKLTHSIQPPLKPHPSISCKKSYWVAWRKPQQGFIKINIDGSKSSHQAAGGYILRNWEGRFIQAAAFNLATTSVLVVEAIATRNEIRAAVQAGFSNIHIEGDNKILI